MKKLLVIGYVWPEPNSSAAGSRMLQLLACLQSDGYQITYASPAQASDHAVDLAALSIDKVNIEINNQSFDLFLQNLQPTAVLFDRFMMEEQFAWRVEKHCPQALRILDTEDLHCLRFARQKLAKSNPQSIIKDVDDKALFSEHAKREIAAILRCDLTLMISQYEINTLQERFNVPKHILAYIPFMINDKPPINKTAFHDRQHFVSIGNFRHDPNWDAVLTLKKTIWPLIRQQCPNAMLHIYGAYPPKKATQLHNQKQGFLVKGWVENAQEMLGQTRVLLAPLRFGAGLKGKFIDAAQCGLPSVTTSIGSEGFFENTDISALLVEDDFTEFAKQASALYNNEARWQGLQDNCERFISSHFSYEKYANTLINQLNRIADNLEQHRLQNFTGAMLRHHSLKSTQYMSQWIEAKNKL